MKFTAKITISCCILEKDAKILEVAVQHLDDELVRNLQHLGEKDGREYVVQWQPVTQTTVGGAFLPDLEIERVVYYSLLEPETAKVGEDVHEIALKEHLKNIDKYPTVVFPTKTEGCYEFQYQNKFWRRVR